MSSNPKLSASSCACLRQNTASPFLVITPAVTRASKIVACVVGAEHEARGLICIHILNITEATDTIVGGCVEISTMGMTDH